jgi:hypothetical protein
MTPIEKLSAKQFAAMVRFRLEHTQGKEEFVVTRMGGTNFAVSIQFGYNYTRPQLIEKYKNVAAVVHPLAFHV